MAELAPAVAPGPPRIGPGAGGGAEEGPLGLPQGLPAEEVTQGRGHLAHHVLQGADGPRPHQAPRFAGVGAEVPAVGDQNLPPPRPGQGHQLAGVRRAGGEGLLYQDVAVVLQGGPGVLVVLGVGGGDQHPVQGHLPQQLGRGLRWRRGRRSGPAPAPAPPHPGGQIPASSTSSRRARMGRWFSAAHQPAPMTPIRATRFIALPLPRPLLRALPGSLRPLPGRERL